jgi:hypothetical protein
MVASERQLQEIAMSCQLNLTTSSALTVIEAIKPRHGVAMLLAVLGLAALTSTGASACGRLPAGVEVSGPVLRRKVEAQPVIMPHCNLTPPADAVAAGEPSGRPDNSGANSASRLAAPN